MKEDTENIKNRYAKLAATLDERAKKVTELQELTKHYKENAKPVDDLLDRVEIFLQEQPKYGTDPDRIRKEVEKIDVSL